PVRWIRAGSWKMRKPLIIHKCSLPGSRSTPEKTAKLSNARKCALRRSIRRAGCRVPAEPTGNTCEYLRSRAGVTETGEGILLSLPAGNVGEPCRNLTDALFIEKEFVQGVPPPAQELGFGAVGQGRVHLDGSRDGAGFDVHGPLGIRSGLGRRHQARHGFLARRETGNAQGNAIAEEDLGEGLAHDGLYAPTHQGLGGMFARGAATEILVHEKNGRSPEAGVVEGVGLALLLEAGAIVLEGVHSQAVENDTAEEAGGNDAIGID